MRTLLLLSILILAGCGTVQQHRARALHERFRALTPAQQQAALAGIVEPGFTSNMVYVALGTPRQRFKSGISMVWTYVGWIDKTGRFRSTWDLYTGDPAEMQQLVVLFDHDKVMRVIVGPLN